MTRVHGSRTPEPLSDADLMTLRRDVGPAPFDIGAALVPGDCARAGDVVPLPAGVSVAATSAALITMALRRVTREGR